MLTDLQLIDLQVRTLFTHDTNSRLLRVNEPGGGAPAPRFFFGRTRTGNIWRFRADLSEKLIRDLERLCDDEQVNSELGEMPRHLNDYDRLLKTDAPVKGFEAGPVYRFAEYPLPTRPAVSLTEDDGEMLRGGFEKLIEELPEWQPFVAIIEDGRAVSVCRSVRITPHAHEAGVETLPEYRGHGYAVDVTVAWARLVQMRGAIPFYSTSWENTASQAVARKLQLTMFAADFHVH